MVNDEIVFKGSDLLRQIRITQLELNKLNEMVFNKYPSLKKEKEILSELIVSDKEIGRKEGAIAERKKLSKLFYEGYNNKLNFKKLEKELGGERL